MRRIPGRPLLVIGAGAIVVAYACSTALRPEVLALPWGTFDLGRYSAAVILAIARVLGPSSLNSPTRRSRVGGELPRGGPKARAR